MGSPAKAQGLDLAPAAAAPASPVASEGLGSLFRRQQR